MGKACCAVGCHARFSKGCGLQFYRFPRESEKRRLWIAALSRKNWEPTQYSWICSNHFIGGKKSSDPTSPAYVPSLFVYVNSPRKRRVEKALERYCRINKTKRRRRTTSEVRDKEVDLGTNCEDSEMQSVEEHEVDQELEQSWCEASEALILLSTSADNTEPCISHVCTQTETTLKDLDELEKASCETDVLRKQVELLSKDNKVLSEENLALKQYLITPEALEGNDSKVQYFTGLPSFKILKCVFDFVSVSFKTYSRTVLPLFNQFVMVLVRLRLNMDTDQLSYHFGIHSSNVSRTIRRWINVLHERLGVLVKWPEREELYKTMPTDFKHFGKCAVIIDCFEVFMEQPSYLKPRAQTWSNYKQHNTCKFLIGITPQGSISYVSQAWGGRVSDVYRTEKCGILKNLMHGDLVLADRGFTIQNAASHYMAEVKIPSFTRGKAQLSPCDIATTRELARVRIQVERVIGMLRQKYKILSSTLPINLVMNDPDCIDDDISMIDKIVIVCSALCNCCDSIIPFN